MQAAVWFVLAIIVAIFLVATFVRYCSNWPWVARLRKSFEMRPRIKWLLIAGAFNFTALGVGYLTLPEPVVRTNLKAQTERIVIEVVDPDNAGQRIGGMRARAASGGEGSCINGLLTPFRGAIVTLLRTWNGTVRMNVSRPNGMEGDTFGYRTADGKTERFKGEYDIEVDSQCAGRLPKRFSLHGVVQFGREFLPASPERDVGDGYLAEGTLHIYLHAVEQLFEFIRLPARFYHVESLNLPTGSRIIASSKVNDQLPIWWGIAELDEESKKFSIDATTNAQSIQVILAGGKSHGSVVKVGDFYRITKDPNLFWAFAILSMLVAVILNSLTGLGRKLWRWFARQNSTSGSKLLQLLLPLFAAAAVTMDPFITAVRSEPVRLENGPNSGQGWMFADANGVCRIVTAAHVLERDGKLTAPQASGRTFSGVPTSSPVQPDSNLDLAFLRAHPSFSCPASALADADFNRRLETAVTATLDPIRETTQQTVTLTRRSREIGSSGAHSIVYRVNGDLRISQGMSGGAILDATGRPLGIITDTDPSSGQSVTAIRIDVASTLLRTRIAVERPTQRTEIVGWNVVHGRGIDPTRGIDQLLEGGRGWTVAADRGYVVFDFKLKVEQSLSFIAFRVDEGARGKIKAIQIFGSPSAQGNPLDWPPVAMCMPPPELTEIICQFQPRSLTSIRIQIMQGQEEATYFDFRSNVATKK